MCMGTDESFLKLKFTQEKLSVMVKMLVAKTNAGG